MRTPKFGAKLRKLAVAASRSKQARYECTRCHKKKVDRTGYARWECNSCGARFAGGAYAFRTSAGEIATRLIAEAAKSA